MHRHLKWLIGKKAEEGVRSGLLKALSGRRQRILGHKNSISAGPPAGRNEPHMESMNKASSSHSAQQQKIEKSQLPLTPPWLFFSAALATPEGQAMAQRS